MAKPSTLYIGNTAQSPLSAYVLSPYMGMGVEEDSWEQPASLVHELSPNPSPYTMQSPSA